jgi:hypothetical protein
MLMCKFYDGMHVYEHIPGCERDWIEEGSHLGVWSSNHSHAAQKMALNFLEKHRKAPTP